MTTLRITLGIAIGITPLEPNQYLSPHPLYSALGKDKLSRQDVYRSLFRTELDNEAISDIRLALNQNQPLGNSRFYTKVEAMIGQWREPKPQGGPRKKPDESLIQDGDQGELPI